MTAAWRNTISAFLVPLQQPAGPLRHLLIYEKTTGPPPCSRGNFKLNCSGRKKTNKKVITVDAEGKRKRNFLLPAERRRRERPQNGWRG
jgi:hypothetical protein